MSEIKTATDRLAAKLSHFYDGLGDYERHSLHLLTSVALGSIAPQGDVPANGIKRDVWKAGVKLLAHINPAGLAYVGEPPFMIDYLPKLQREAVEQKSVSHRTGPQELSPGGEIALKLAGDRELKLLVERAVGFAVDPALVTSYLYYCQLGDHLYPHVDTEAFAINCIILLEQEIPLNYKRKSALLVWDTDADKRRIELEPGEMAILHASGTVHAREAIAPGETVTMLTIGFQKANNN